MAGAKVYASKCALCHGPGGKGDGPASKGLNPKPRDHTDKSYMSTLSDEALLHSIREGKGTMPAWGKVLKPEELSAVAMFVRSLSK
ncbi:MAG: cytochrome c [Candidatus Eisenbacteria bacterium]|uniref:Cytochrome c n=1 Tax=Eiseniibacteriota bacterium TaxID=2212470 RepID=A0A849SEJ9_UNCEI|nr:cytochrome c [Candidatus Eisenbacteria bacterium]